MNSSLHVVQGDLGTQMEAQSTKIATELRAIREKQVPGILAKVREEICKVTDELKRVETAGLHRVTELSNQLQEEKIGFNEQVNVVLTKFKRIKCDWLKTQERLESQSESLLSQSEKVISENEHNLKIMATLVEVTVLS